MPHVRIAAHFIVGAKFKDFPGLDSHGHTPLRGSTRATPLAVQDLHPGTATQFNVRRQKLLPISAHNSFANNYVYKMLSVAFGVSPPSRMRIEYNAPLV